MEIFFLFYLPKIYEETIKQLKKHYFSGIVCQPFHADLVNGEVICSDANNEGSSCFFTCGPNFVLSGTSVLTCLDDGNGDFLGAWLSLPPRCLRKGFCLFNNFSVGSKIFLCFTARVSKKARKKRSR